MWDFLTTFALFYVVILLTPLLLLCYVVLSIVKKVWLFVASIRHPQVEFLQSTTIRSLLDTHRNQGIISVLIAVKGQAQPDAVRRHLQEVVKRRDKFGNLAFPRLRHCLVTRCGAYGWERGKFDLDQNVTLAPASFKGRSITEYNVQEYVSEIVSKYLPQAVSPWQVTIIPSAEDQHYILFKLHHILLNEGLNIGDLLPLVPPMRQAPSSFIAKSPLVEVLPRPVAIPKLKEKLGEEISNLWNEFISNYDPLECPKLLKTSPTLTQFFAIALVTIVATIRESRKGFYMVKPEFLTKAKYVLVTLKREGRKRNINLPTLLKSVLVSLDPRILFKFVIKNLYLIICWPLKMYMAVFREIGALYCCITQSYCNYNNTIIGMIYNYVPLLYGCIKEVIFYTKSLIEAPRTIMQDILLQKESFQTITLCGRKSVAWSDPVKNELIQTISKATGLSSTEISLAAISACISRYFIVTKHVIPDFLPLSLRNVNSNYIYATGPNIKPTDSVSGMLCINLPVLDPEKDVSILENLVEVKKHFRDSMERQGISHFLSLLQTKYGFLTKILPLSLLGVYLRYLSRKYTVSMTELTSRHPNVSQRTLWGQEVTSVIYWRPPQANSSVSLCLNEYADHVRLCVMADSQLAPHHPLLAKGFPEHLAELARSIGVAHHQ